MCVCVCVCVCMYIYIVLVYIYIYIYIYVSIYIYVYINHAGVPPLLAAAEAAERREIKPHPIERLAILAL